MCISFINNETTTDDTMAVKDAPASATGGRHGGRQIRQTGGDKPLMVSTRRAGEMLGLKDAGSVLKQVHRGRLEGKKMGNKYLITVRSIERFAFGDFDK